MDRTPEIYLQRQSSGRSLFSEVQKEILVLGWGRDSLWPEIQPVHRRRHRFPERGGFIRHSHLSALPVHSASIWSGLFPNGFYNSSGGNKDRQLQRSATKITILSYLVAGKESYIGSNAGDSSPFDITGKHILVVTSWILPGCKQFSWWPVVPGNILHAAVVPRMFESRLAAVVAQCTPSLHVGTVILR